jgi:acetyltransferase-like isoleucine patch superfamily enzyme
MVTFIAKTAVVCDNVKLGRDCVIEDFVVIGKQGEKEITIIGSGSIIRAGSVIYSNVTIGKNFRTGVHAMIREKTEIGNDCLVGTNSIIDGECKIGDNVRIQSGAYITFGSKIGNDVFIAPCVVTTNDKYPPSGQGADLAGPTIENGVSVCAGAILLPGVKVCRGAVVGAGAVVTHNVDRDMVVIGNPAHFYKLRSEVYK